MIIESIKNQGPTSAGTRYPTYQAMDARNLGAIFQTEQFKKKIALHSSCIEKWVPLHFFLRKKVLLPNWIHH